jgi:hypothetical protein
LIGDAGIIVLFYIGIRPYKYSTTTSTIALTATITPRPSFTPRPTQTPYLTGTAWAATAKAETQIYMDKMKDETQQYYDPGYLSTTDGAYRNYNNFSEEWAQLGWYQWWPLKDTASDFFLSAHFKWSSSYRNADLSGCGFAFAIQENSDHYAAFLDRSKVYFVESEEYYTPFHPTRGSELVSFANPFDQPVEADFTLILNDADAYVLIDEDLVGEYPLSQTKVLHGNLGLTLLSGTNKDFGTRCEMTNVHAWIAK